ncbi:MAG: transglycosylase domain-containing protein [Bauldia sp.]|nr:transglycosylase domain-containing protein [Bauldia sp.]
MTVGDETQGPRRARRTAERKPRPLWWRVLRGVVIAVVIVAAIPLLLTPLYRVVAPVSTLMVYERLFGNGAERDWVTLDQMSPALIRAVVASEDAFFCRHHGIDWGAVREVIQAGDSRGASTIAMQTAKNLFLWPGRSWLRKGLEVPLAWWANLTLGKRRLMEVYLNVAEWGPGIFGAGRAAQFHFGVPPDALTARQAALLAVTLPDPIGRNPAAPGPGLSALADRIASRAADVSCLGLSP